MIDKKLISIIVPIYNVEQYINQCIQSIIEQTYTNLEIILVDDGSPDNCPQICDEWAKKDKRIKVLHKTNGGLSDARNWGLDIATGDYIMFVDSDDFIEPNMAKSLLCLLEKHKADIAHCESKRFSEENKKTVFETYHMKQTECVYNSTDFMGLIFQTKISCAVWNKLYKTEIINKTRFAVGKCNEDIIFLFELLKSNYKIVATNDTLYNYRISPNSITTSSLSKRNLDYLYNMQEMEKEILKNKKDWMSPFMKYRNRVAVRMGWLLYKYDTNKSYIDSIKLCKDIIKRNIWNILLTFNLNNMPIRCRIQALILLSAKN